MARKPGDSPIQFQFKSKDVRLLTRAAFELEDRIARDRKLAKGPMIKYLVYWFLSLSLDEKARIVDEGYKLSGDAISSETERGVIKEAPRRGRGRPKKG